MTIGEASLIQVKDRKLWVDFLRGIAMLLVVWEHIASDWIPEFVITGPIKMPAFFVLSAYLFNDQNGNIQLFSKKIFQHLIFPWFFLSLVWLKPIYALLTGNPGKIPGYFITFLSGKTLWFLPCLILAEFIFFFVKKFFSKSSTQYLAMASLSIIGALINGGGKTRFALWDNALIVQCYFLLGYWYKNNENRIRDILKSKRIVVLLFFAYVSLTILTFKIYPGQFIDVHYAKYYNYCICIILCFVAMMLAIKAAQSIKKYPRWIIFVGQNTLLFYIGHYWPRLIISLAEMKLNIIFPPNAFVYLLKFIFICGVMSILAIIFNKFLPFAVGKKKRIIR